MKPNKIFTSAVLGITIFTQLIPTVSVFAATQSVARAGGDIAVPAKDNIDWSAVDWDGDITLLTDFYAHNREMSEWAVKNPRGGTPPAAAPKKYKMTDREVLDYYHVPDAVAAVAREYGAGSGEFGQKISAPSVAKEALKNKIRSVQPLVSTLATPAENILPENIIDLKTAPFLKVKKLIPTVPLDAPDVKILNVKNNSAVAPRSLKNISPRGLKEKVDNNSELLTVEPSVSKKLGLFIKTKFKELFAIDAARADPITPIIDYYSGIEKKPADYALYYISARQNSDGSFGEYNQYETTAETVFMLSEVNKDSNTQYQSALNYLLNTATTTTRDKALKARVVYGAGGSYIPLLAELAALKNEDNGFGYDAGYTSDILTSAEAALTMFAANYSVGDQVPKTLYYVLNQIPANGAIKSVPGGVDSFYAANKLARILYPFKNLSIGDGSGPSISVQSKINALFSFLSSQYDSDSGSLLGTRDAVDLAMTLDSWQLYNIELSKQAGLSETLKNQQYADGSFDNGVLATVYGVRALARPDLKLINAFSTGSLANRATANFTLTVRNNGNETASGGILNIFMDNVDTGLKIDLNVAGFALAPGESADLNFSVSSQSWVGMVNFKFYLENATDFNYDDNWLETNFTFAIAADGVTPALPMYYIAKKHSASGVANLNIRWPVKTDPLRKNYVAMWRRKGISAWSLYGIANTSDGAFLGGTFSEGTVYEVTAGVLHQDGSTITYFPNFTDVKMSGNDNLYLGGVSGNIMIDNRKTAAVAYSGFDISNGRSGADGNFSYGGIVNGATVAYAEASYYDKIYTRFSVPINATTTNVRLFSHLKADATAPALSSVELRYASAGKVKTQKEYTLFASGSDNVALKEGDFYLWNPTEAVWLYLGTAEAAHGSEVSYRWYIPQSTPFGRGYKIKAVLRDYRGNQSEFREWGPFEVIDGAPPVFTINNPSGGAQVALGATTTITWNTLSTNPVNTVGLYLFFPSAYSTIADSIPNTGRYDWKAPNNFAYAGTQLRIKIAGADSVNLENGYSFSADYFSIVDNSSPPSAPWTRPIKITTTTEMNWPGGTYNGSALSYDNAGNLHLVYLYSKDYMGAGGRMVTDTLYYQVKSAAGVWSAPQVAYTRGIATDANLTGYKPISDLNLAIDDNGRPHLVWLGGAVGGAGCSTYNNSEVYYMYQSGGVWFAPENISNTAGKSSEEPTLAIGNGTVNVSWADGRIWSQDCAVTGAPKIFVKSRSLGSAWQAAAQLYSAYFPSYPRLSFTKDNKLHLVFKDGASNRILHVYKTGLTWSALKELFVGDADYLAVAAGPTNTLHSVWSQSYTDPATNRRRVRVMYNYFNGSNWGSAAEASPIWNNYYVEYAPRVGVDRQDKAQIMFEHYNSASGTKKLVWITKNGGIWTGPAALNLSSQNISTNLEKLAVFGDKMGLVYSTNYSFVNEIYYNEANSAVSSTPMVSSTPPAPTDGTSVTSTLSPNIRVTYNGVVLTNSSTIIFVTTTVGAVSTKSVAITNTGAMNLNITGVRVISAVTSTCSWSSFGSALANIGVGRTSTINVIFRPQFSGRQTCTLIMANNVSGQNPFVVIFNGMGQYPAPPPVSGLAATSTVGAVRLNWTRYPNTYLNALRFNIYRSTSNTGRVTSTAPIAQITSTTSVQYLDTSGVLNRLYYYALVVEDKDGRLSGGSWVGQAKNMYPAPARVSGIVALSTLSGVKLNWSTYSNSYNNLLRFNIYRSTTSSVSVTSTVPIIRITNTTTVQYVDIAGVTGTYYHYAIIAEDKDGRLSGGSWVGRVRKYFPNPTPITGLVATSTVGAVRLNWTRYVDTVGNSLKFYIYRSTTNTGVITSSPYLDQVVTSTIQYRDTSAATNTRYYYAVIAVDRNGKLSSGSWIGPAKKMFPNPTPITGLIATSTVGAVRLNWTRYVDTYGNTQRFNIYRSANNTGRVTSTAPIAQITTTSSVQYLDTTGVLNTLYYYAVVAVDKDGRLSNGSWVGQAKRK